MKGSRQQPIRQGLDWLLARLKCVSALVRLIPYPFNARERGLTGTPRPLFTVPNILSTVGLGFW